MGLFVAAKITFFASKSCFWCQNRVLGRQNHVFLRQNHVFDVKIMFFASKSCFRTQHNAFGPKHNIPGGEGPHQKTIANQVTTENYNKNETMVKWRNLHPIALQQNCGYVSCLAFQVPPYNSDGSSSRGSGALPHRRLGGAWAKSTAYG